MFKRTKEIAIAAAKAVGFFGMDHDERRPDRVTATQVWGARLAQLAGALPKGGAPFNGAADDCSGSSQIKARYSPGWGGLPDTLLGWFLNQGFVGHTLCAYLAQHWLIDKVCLMPARDAIRQGYAIVSEDGGDLDPKILAVMKKADEQYRLMKHLLEFVHKGRVYGIRLALFKVQGSIAEDTYYENPFNVDAVTPGSYKGVVQIDPQWCAPVLDERAAVDPLSPHFYEPTWWLVNGKKIHRSHFVIFRTSDVPDMLKPTYLYGGKPIPQMIVERVYAAERTANEAPQLAMTKRTTVLNTNAAKALANVTGFEESLTQWCGWRDNYGVKVIDKEAESIEQFDTTLTDLDAVIMTQYQLVAAAGGVPATKLLGTTPKGFNSTGEYEEANYHEELESLQTHDLTPFVERHNLLVMKSRVMPKLGLTSPVDTSIVWAALDSPTAKEMAETNKAKTDADTALVNAGAIDGTDVRNRLRQDRDSGYYGLQEIAEPLDTPPPMGDALGLDELQRVGGAWLVTNQTMVDPDIVLQKIEARDFTVQVSPPMPGDSGKLYRIIVDGHHSLAAAHVAGVEPVFVEGNYGASDYKVVGIGP